MREHTEYKRRKCVQKRKGMVLLVHLSPPALPGRPSVRPTTVQTTIRICVHKSPEFAIVQSQKKKKKNKKKSHQESLEDGGIL